MFNRSKTSHIDEWIWMFWLKRSWKSRICMFPACECKEVILQLIIQQIQASNEKKEMLCFVSCVRVEPRVSVSFLTSRAARSPADSTVWNGKQHVVRQSPSVLWRLEAACWPSFNVKQSAVYCAEMNISLWMSQRAARWPWHCIKWPGTCYYLHSALAKIIRWLYALKMSGYSRVKRVSSLVQHEGNIM